MNTPNQDIVKGFKFLSPLGATEGRDMPGASHKRGQQAATYYPLPLPWEKWGQWLTHPDPVFDDKDCGPGRFHLMNKLDARYAPKDWWPWFASGRGVTGSSNEKTSVAEVRLRRIRPEVFWRMIRFGWCKGANLYGANLSSADLERALNLDKARNVPSGIPTAWKAAQS